MLENEDIEVSLMSKDDLLGVCYLHHYIFSQGKLGLFHQMGEEKQPLENCLICFFKVISPEGSWQFFNKLNLLFNIEQLLDIGMLLDITIDLLRKWLTYMVLIH